MKDGNLIHKARKPRGITKASTEIQDIFVSCVCTYRTFHIANYRNSKNKKTNCKRTKKSDNTELILLRH